MKFINYDHVPNPKNLIPKCEHEFDAKKPTYKLVEIKLSSFMEYPNSNKISCIYAHEHISQIQILMMCVCHQSYLCQQ